MSIGKTMIQDPAESAANKNVAYETPRFERHDLRVITLGGTPGDSDSGAPATEFPPINGGPENKTFEEDWDNDI